MDAETIDMDALNGVCERFLANMLRMQLVELEALGAGDIPYAHRARRYLRRYDAAAASCGGHPSPQVGRHLRSVG